MGASFVRNASPDAGVECLWRLPSGEEWGWQAKFPHTGPSKSLWAQLDKSVRTSILKRPKLTRYYVCLPLNLPDPKLTKCKSARQKWDACVARWKRLAGKRKRRLEFNLWDDHEIWNRLCRDEHRGRRTFWFAETVFTGDWFRNHLKATLDQAGDRYDALLNVEVPEAGLFPALARTAALWKRLDEWAIELRKALTSLRPYEDEEPMGGETKALRKSLADCLAAINALAHDESAILDFPTVAHRLAAATDACSALDKKRSEVESETSKKLGQTEGHQPGAPGHGGRGVSWHTVREIHRRIDHAREFLATKSAKVINNPVLLLTGDAGSGKTHLLCGIAETLAASGVPIILLLGEQFHDAEPWGQISTNLGLRADRDEFLGALDAAAEAARTRALIIIDALNEGDGLKVWPRHLAAFISQIRHWSRISVCLSLRSGYEGTVLPPGLHPDYFIRVVHRGFANLELEAAARFFEHFGIATPSIPVLTPEFANPLFLKLFCRALQNASLKEVPTGLHGITEVFDFFLETINIKLSKPTVLDFDPASRVVQKAVERLAELMVQTGSPRLSLKKVKAELDRLLPSRGYETSLERRLYSEGVLTRQPDFGYGSKIGAETVRFTYQRFTDNRIVQILLRGVKAGQERDIFTKGAPLWALVEPAGSFGQGIWDALAIQLPECASTELPDVLPRSSHCDILRDAFLASVLWRKRTALGVRTEYWIEYYREVSEESYAKTMDMLLGVSTCTGHRFNADFLHQYLVTQPMSDRDAMWSIFLFQEYGEGRSADRLIDWANSETAHAHFNNETARLSAIALSWFLTTSHRFVRDRATKALVSLLEKRILVLCGILRQFEHADDPYVLERLYAVALGCALCTENKKDLKVLAQQVYDVIFKAGSPPAHMTLRDYAKSVVQAALARGIQLDCEVSRVIPPYRTKWIGRLPSLTTLKHRLDENVLNEDSRGGQRLYASVTCDDFCFYEMNDLHLWSPRRLGAQARPSPKQIYDAFEAVLTEQQRLLLERYEQKSRSREAMKLIYGGGPDHPRDDGEKQIISCEQDLLRALGARLAGVYKLGMQKREQMAIGRGFE